MKIVITSSGNNLDGDMDPRFGRCEYFIVVDTDSMSFEAIPNPALAAPGGAGIQAAQFIVDLKGDAVISGNYGPNAFGVLSAAAMDLYRIETTMPVKDVVARFNTGELEKVDQPTSGSHSGNQGK